MLRYGGVPGNEQEVILRLDHDDKIVHACSTWPAWSRKLERRYGEPESTVAREGWVTVANWTLPLRTVGLRSAVKRTPSSAAGPRTGKPFAKKAPATGKKGGKP